MFSSSVIVPLLALSGLATAALNTTQSYKLRTQLQPGSEGKTEFDNLYLVSYHTGAGYGDATFLPNRTIGLNGFLNQTNTTTGDADGVPLYNQEFDQGNGFPWQLYMAANTNFYAAWQPVRVNAGGGYSSPFVSGFFVNETGLQWTSTPGEPGARDDRFGGWLVCTWWHNVPQLFFRQKFYNDRAPTLSSCADVLLVPEYI